MDDIGQDEGHDGECRRRETHGPIRGRFLPRYL